MRTRWSRESGERLIDNEALNQFIQGDVELLAELATLFVQHQPDMNARLNLAVDNCDRQALREAAHLIKSRLGYFHAHSLVEFAADAESNLTKKLLEKFDELARTNSVSDAELIEMKFRAIRADLDKRKAALSAQQAEREHEFRHRSAIDSHRSNMIRWVGNRSVGQHCVM